MTAQPYTDEEINKMRAMDDPPFEFGRFFATIEAKDAEIVRLTKLMEASEELCKIYFILAASIVGEDKVREQRDLVISKDNN